MRFKDISDKDFIKLAKLRLAHEPLSRMYKTTITKIEIEKKYFLTDGEIDRVRFSVSMKEFLTESICIIVFSSKFYPDEFLFLQKLGIDFTTKI